MFNDSFVSASATPQSAGVGSSPSACPCGTGRAYAKCCGPLHAGEAPADALSLMRSRYSAYVYKLSSYLLDTWHPTTRPPTLDIADRPGLRTNWLGLQVISHRSIDPQRAEVSFIARVKVGGGPAQRMTERSRFLMEDGRWFYVDGEVGPK